VAELREESITMQPRKTSLLSIDFDVDSYLARGGKLLDLELVPSTADREQIEATVRTMSEAKLNRIRRVGEFLTRVGELGADPESSIGETLTEEQLQRIWCGAAPEVSIKPQ
jgi:hypothetical protein